MEMITNVPYNESGNAAHQMDVFVPERNETGIGLLFIHGGGWSSGKREAWHAVAKHCCGLGYSCATISYRLAPAAQYPAQVDDARAALACWKQHAGSYRFDPNKVVTVGSSAGGYLAAMLALLGSEETASGKGDSLCDNRVLASVLYCPVTELREGQGFVHQFMGGTPEEKPALYEEANPIERASRQAGLNGMSFLVIQGDRDETTSLDDTRAFCEQVRFSGGSVELAVLEGVGHGFGYGTETPAQKASIGYMEQFLRTLSTES